MNAISKIIFDALISGQGINLPEIGSLYVEREPAKFISKTEVMPPNNRVLFSHKQSVAFRSVVELMVADGKDDDIARIEYSEWLAKAQSNKGLIEIPEVGVLKHDFFYPSAALHDTLNPGGQKSVNLKPRSGGGKKFLIALLIVLGVAIVLFFVVSLDQFLTTRNDMSEAVQAELVCPTVPKEPAHKGEERKVEEKAGKKEKKADKKKALTAEEIIEAQLAEYAAANKKNESREEYGVPPAIPECGLEKEEKITGWQKFCNLFRKKETAPVEPEVIIIERIEYVEVVPECAEDKRSMVAPQVEKPAVSYPTYHVVVGVFDKPANADRLIREDKLGIGRNAYSKMPYKDGATMVVAYSSANKDEAIRRMNQLRKKDKEVWVYIQK